MGSGKSGKRFSHSDAVAVVCHGICPFGADEWRFSGQCPHGPAPAPLLSAGYCQRQIDKSTGERAVGMLLAQFISDYAGAHCGIIFQAV